MPLPRVPLVVLAAGVFAASASCGRSASAPTAAEAPPAAPPPVTLPAPPPLPMDCGAPAVPAGTGYTCVYTGAVYALDINEAIARVVNEHPDFFDLDQRQSTWSYFVRQPDRYLAQV